MKKEDKNFLTLFLRYIALVLIALPGMNIFYYLLSAPTIYPVYWVLKLFYNPVLLGNIILVGNKTIEVVGACVAGAAYYLLLILILSTAKIKLLKRMKIILFSFSSFLLINIVRVTLLSFLYIEGSAFFDITHKIFWYLGSTIFIVLIWFLCVKIFSIKEIPIYSDLKDIYRKSSLKK